MESRFSYLTGSLISGSGLLPSEETGKPIAPVPGAGDQRAPRSGTGRMRIAGDARPATVGSAVAPRSPAANQNRLVPLLLAMDREVLKRSVVIWVRKRRGGEPGQPDRGPAERMRHPARDLLPAAGGCRRPGCTRGAAGTPCRGTCRRGRRRSSAPHRRGDNLPAERVHPVPGTLEQHPGRLHITCHHPGVRPPLPTQGHQGCSWRQRLSW